MGRNTVRNLILPEKEYRERMKAVVEPYLAKRKREGFCEREKGNRIFYMCCLADRPKGVIVLSHGYTETIEKHVENIYYFLCGGYHVFMPEHCGHGRSYRMCSDKKDLCLVHVDDYQRYVKDLLFVCDMAAQEFPQLPLFLYGHSMGGGIAAAAAAQEPELFSGLILSSPMIQPKSGSVPWLLACLAAGGLCLVGKKEEYLTGRHPYDGTERFADSAACSEARFVYYREKKKKEPFFQMNAASYGWFWQAVRLKRYLQKKAWRHITCPVVIFQAERDTYVSKKAQEKFAGKLNRCNKGRVKLVRVPGTKHEIFNSGMDILERYWRKIFFFLGH
ncbi:MAG: alpha/beta hydrolase [Lachnospiraceae bacterium]|nr:alpha/beta hydrolase [Lachnospiraceae bacterium]MDE7331533.1 alpha/beta hydrolase [Lachnospiraceae bacterium]